MTFESDPTDDALWIRERRCEAEREHDGFHDIRPTIEPPVANRRRQARRYFAGAEPLHGARGDAGVTHCACGENRDRDIERAGEAGVARESLAFVAAAHVGDVAQSGDADVAIGADGVRVTRRCDE